MILFIRAYLLAILHAKRSEILMLGCSAALWTYFLARVTGETHPLGVWFLLWLIPTWDEWQQLLKHERRRRRRPPP